MKKPTRGPASPMPSHSAMMARMYTDPCDDCTHWVGKKDKDHAE